MEKDDIHIPFVAKQGLNVSREMILRFRNFIYYIE